MRKILFLLAFMPIMAAAQTPSWYDADFRRINYPSEEYFTGFSVRQIAGDENESTALSKVKDAARVEAVSSVRVHVQNVTEDQTHSKSVETTMGLMEEIYETFDSHTVLTVDVELPGLKTETCRKGNEVAAFAYVKRRDLIRQLDKAVTVNLTKAESQMDMADEMTKQGRKIDARKQIETLDKTFAEIERDQKLLLAVDKDADEESLQLSDTRRLQQRYVRMSSELKHGINIYLNCKADMFGNSYPTLANTIKGELSEIGCTFVTSAAEADWAVYVTANAREYNAPTIGGHTTYFAYIDATLAIDKVVTNQRIYEDALTEKGGHTHNYTEAARDGYKQIAPKIIELINQYIKQ